VEDAAGRAAALVPREARPHLVRLRGQHLDAGQVGERHPASHGSIIRERYRPRTADDIHTQLTKYLTDAHSIEEQALAQLRRAPDEAGEPRLAEAHAEHLRETERHERTTRLLLEQRDAAPSRVEDVAMKAGGVGFLLFAKLQPDTPGKLHAHSLSYEALELASYELLGRVAERADEEEVAGEARRIRDEERRMIERLEERFDLAVEASLREKDAGEIREELRSYLADAHAIEEQAVQLLEKGPELAGDERIAQVYEEHLAETREHAELVRQRLKALGGAPSSLKDAALRLGALNWGAFFRGHPDTPGKLAAFAYAFEHLEIGSYELLKRVARRAGDRETEQLCDRILAQERAAAAHIADVFDAAAAASLEAAGVRWRRALGGSTPR
jgi:ferritin-like metal-binding protein YciE